MKKRWIAMVLVLCICTALLSGCDVGRMIARSFIIKDETGTGAAVDGADLVINRIRRSDEIPMGPEGTWTIFVYLCGSDLESEAGFATDNLAEIIEASRDSSVRFVVETGGSRQWNNDFVSSGVLQRFLISNGRMQEVDRQPLANMGDEDTLADFLSWGVAEYPSYYMGVILWNHGGGSQAGVAYDELFDYDSLTLPELDDAFEQVYGEMTSNFEFIGFDACLMATVETANVFANYGNYMVASQESEPGTGWDYYALAQTLQDDPFMDGAQLGRAVCDDYYEKCDRYGGTQGVTLSVVDLEQIDPLLYAFDDAAKILAKNSGNGSFMATSARRANDARTFGGNSPSEGYSNMADLGGLMEELEPELNETSDQVEQALSQAVVYQVQGAAPEEASGLSVFYPYNAQSWELKEMARVSVSAHYLTYVDSVANQGAGSAVDGYIGGYWSDTEDGDTTGSWDDYWDQYEQDPGTGLDFYEDGADGEIRILEGPALDDAGTYYIRIDPDSLPYLSRASFSLFADQGDGTYVDLGSDNDLFMDWETGLAQDNFQGTWAALPDGQILPIVLLDVTKEYNLYTTPVLYNGRASNLRIKWVWDDPDDPENTYGHYEAAGIWDGVEDDGRTDRQVFSLRDGDTIAPLYSVYNEAGELVDTQAGDPWTVSGGLPISVEVLPEGDYRYSFLLTDVYQNITYTEFTVFYVDENGDLFYYE